jgi:hypothetical protein
LLEAAIPTKLDLKAQTRRISVMGTLTGYGIGVVIVFAILNGIAWLLGSPLLHGLNVFSAGFVLGMLGTSIAVYLYGYRKVA